jgi:hypothetical protein
MQRKGSLAQMKPISRVNDEIGIGHVVECATGQDHAHYGQTVRICRIPAGSGVIAAVDVR